MSLKYPLHKYDESGRLKPPLFVYVLMLFVCRGLLILIVSLSFREDSERLLRVFYPQPYHFYLSLIPILPAIFALYLVSYRNKLWSAKNYRIFKCLSWCMTGAILLDMGVQFYILNGINFAFSATHGVSLFACFCGLIYIYQSQYMRHLIIDWTRP